MSHSSRRISICDRSTSALLACLAFAGSNATQAALLPISATGWNQDAIAEATTASNHTTSAIDGSDYVVYSVAYGTSFSSGTGLPDNGQVAGTGRTYQLQPYDANNALLVAPGTTGTLTLTTSAPYAVVSLLGFATEGSASATITLHYADTTMTTSTATVPDWFGNASNQVLCGFDRTGRTTNTPDYNASYPCMFAFDLNIASADQSKAIVSMDVTSVAGNPSTGHIVMFAISASAPSVPVTLQSFDID